MGMETHGNTYTRKYVRMGIRTQAHAYHIDIYTYTVYDIHNYKHGHENAWEYVDTEIRAYYHIHTRLVKVFLSFYLGNLLHKYVIILIIYYAKLETLHYFYVNDD